MRSIRVEFGLGFTINFTRGTKMRVEIDGGLPIKLWLTNIEDEALAQAKNLSRLPFAFRHVAIMPDSHVGYGMPIGGVLATKGVIIPNAVGVDIGCGMMAVRTGLTDIYEETIKSVMGDIRKGVPVGFSHHGKPRKWDGFESSPEIDVIQAELSSAAKQLGTLGGGNHFIEIQKGDDGFIWLMLHSGSRNFGFKTARFFHEKAKELCEKWYSNIPHKDLSFLPLDEGAGQDYLRAMNYCLSFAHANREEMMRVIRDAVFDRTGCEFFESINVHHNYAVMEHHFGNNVMVHRKGAIRAYAGDVGIIPGSMGTASYITEGLGNQESFMSSSHGAGRRMGRAEATRTLNLEEEQRKMLGVVHGLRNQADLDEAPGAYKDIDEVMSNQIDLVKITVKLKPLAVIKG
jgi:tRNA-splicing ligase RtcB